MPQDGPLDRAAREIYRVCFTAAPIDFDEARRRDALSFRKAMEAARACARVAEPA